MMLDRSRTTDPTKSTSAMQTFLCRATPDRVVGRTITDVSFYLGSYGMGGVGWTGWQLDGQEWLVLSIHGSDSWLRLRWKDDDRICCALPDQTDWTGHDFVHDKPAAKLHRVWHSNYGGSPQIDNLPNFKHEQCVITSFDLDRTVFRLGLNLGDDEFYLTEDSERPDYWSAGPRRFSEADDLRVALNIFSSQYIDV